MSLPLYTRILPNGFVVLPSRSSLADFSAKFDQLHRAIYSARGSLQTLQLKELYVSVLMFR